MTRKSWFYFNGKLVGKIDILNEKSDMRPPIIKRSKATNYSSFIIGQDQDGVKANFEASQSFYGSLAELNLWDKVLDIKEISRLALCQGISKGNIIKWRKENLALNNIVATDVVGPNFYCKETTLKCTKLYIILFVPKVDVEGII